MGARGGWAPKPWASFSTRTTYLRVPTVDWAAVKLGSKTEFRQAGGKEITQLWNVTTPTPVVAYTVRSGDRYEKTLMVLERTWREPLGAITPDSLAAEGYPDMAHFRRYWMSRTHRRFTPLTNVQVYSVRPWRDTDMAELGAALLSKLYKEHLP